MRLKLLVILLVIGIQVSDGGKILKKLSKELKKVIDGAKFEDFILELAGISDDVSENSDKIHLVADNVANNITNLKADVAVNAANSSKNAMDIADHLPVALDCILVSTGDTGSATNTSEVINTDNSSLTCKDLEEYPLQIYGAVGFNMASLSGFNGLNMDSLPVICGGPRTGHTNPTECYQMKSGKWNFFAHLTHGYVLH
jgi:hypothetical protein